MRRLAVFLLLGLGAILMPGAGLHAGEAHPGEAAPVRVVYHLDADSKGTTTALHQIKNQLTADPTAQIVVVAIGESVPFMTRSSNTAGGYPFALMVEDLQQSGVHFEACGNTMTTLKIQRNQLDDGIVVVPSGMAELARRQSREGYAYIKP
ncbi:MAG: DsrE family protein [Rhodanobacter sp.]|jgi:intracellular sulfur oxidation DsrE/DsrF family protein|nr:DsrE family protein [Rhodanobacter sp.]